MSEIWPVISSVFGVVLVMLIAGACRAQGWLSREADQPLAKLITYVLMPAFFLDRILSDTTVPTLDQAWIPPVFGFLNTAIGLGVALGIARAAGKHIGLDTDAKQRSFAICVGICNYGYIPLPLAMKFYPESVVDLILHNVGVDLALWSIGIAIICGLTTSGIRRALTNPPLIAVVFALTMKQTLGPRGLALPEFVMDAAALLGACAIPMGLILSGAILADFVRQCEWRGSIKTILAAITIRQLVLPLLMLACGGALIAAQDMRVVVMLEASMPSAIFPIVLIRLYEKDTATALRVILATSLAAVILIPIWLAVGQWFLSIP